MIREKSCGAVVYFIENGRIYYLLEHMRKGHVSLPKGHMEKNETEAQTAQREIKEETGLDTVVDTGFSSAFKYSPYEGCIKKVVFFVAEAKTRETTPQLSEVSSVEWLPARKAVDMLTFESDRMTLLKADRYIKQTRLK